MFNIMLVISGLRKAIFLKREIIMNIKMLCAGGKILKTSQGCEQCVFLFVRNLSFQSLTGVVNRPSGDTL